MCRCVPTEWAVQRGEQRPTSRPAPALPTVHIVLVIWLCRCHQAHTPALWALPTLLPRPGN